MQSNSLETSINLSTEGLGLIDIEPPVTPEIDWSIWGEWSFCLLIVILVISFLLKWGKFLYKPAYLLWRLKQLTPPSGHEEFLSVNQAWQLYGVCLQIKSLINPTETLALREFDCLMEQVNQLCFSSQPVSRETYIKLLTQNKHLIGKNSTLRQYIRPLLVTLKAKFKGSR